MNHASMSRKSPSEPHETPNITALVRGKRVAPLSCTPMDGRWISALHLPARLQFTVSEIEEYTSKRRNRREIEGLITTQNVHTTNKGEYEFQEVTILNHAIPNNTTNSSEQIFKTLHILQRAQLADISARHQCEGRRGDASGC